MFYDRFVKLCNERNVSPSAVAEQIGLTRSANTKWAEGKNPRKATIAKLADYFGVPSEYFSEETPTETKASPTAVGDAMKDLMNHLFDSLSEDAKQEALSGLLEISRRDKAKDR